MAKPSQTTTTGDTRNRIVEAARHLFWEKGYAATGLAELLARAEANSGSFYHFFESKDDLLRTVLDTYVSLLAQHIVRPAWNSTADPIERVFALLGGYRRAMLDTQCTYGCPIGRLALEIDPENAPAHLLIARNFTEWKAAVEACLRAAGLAKPDELATFVLTVMEGGVMQARAYRDIAPFDACVRQLRAHLTAVAQSPRPPRRYCQAPTEIMMFGLVAGLLLTALQAASAPAPAPAPAPSPVTVTRIASPEKALRFEVTVPAARDAVWAAFTTSSGLSTWMWRDVRVDLRAGGDWLVLFPGNATGGGTIVSFEPGRRLSMSAMAPEQFPTVRTERTMAVWEFESLGPMSTRVTLIQTGWKAGPEWDAAYDYLASGNATLLVRLYRRFESGPIAWPAQ